MFKEDKREFRRGYRKDSTVANGSANTAFIVAVNAAVKVTLSIAAVRT